MSDDVKYFNQTLWVHNDSQVSQSGLTVDRFVAKDTKWDSISPSRIKFTIKQFNAPHTSASYVSLCHQDIYKFLHILKPTLSNLKNEMTAVEDDQTRQKNLTISFGKKHIIISIVFRVEYGGPCIRFIVSGRNEDYLDSEKIWMSHYDLLSMVKILGDFQDNYFKHSSDMIMLCKLDDVNTHMETINDKLTGYYKETRQLTTPQTVSGSRTFGDKSGTYTENQSTKTVEYNPLEDIETTEKSNPSSSASNINPFEDEPEPIEEIQDSPEKEIHDDMSAYLDEERDKVDLGIPDSIMGDNVKQKPDTSDTKILTSDFTEKFLDNNASNLEMYLTNVVNDIQPFSKITSLLKSKLDFDVLDGVDSKDITATNLFLNIHLKKHVKDNLEKNIKLPRSTMPIVIDINQESDNMSLAYELLMYFIYYTQLRNVLQEKDHNCIENKEFYCFSLKTIMSPLVFGLFRGIDKSYIVSEIKTRYKTHNENGVFKELEDKVDDKYSIKFTLADQIIESEVIRIYDFVISKWDSLTPKKVFLDNAFSKISFGDIENIDLTNEQITKIIEFEFNFQKNGKIIESELSFKGFDDILASICSTYGIEGVTFDNTNLERYIKDCCKDDKDLFKNCLNVTSKINSSYRDLKDVDCDLTVLPENVLKAIFMWDLPKDSRISKNYIHFKECVEKSTITKDMALSLIENALDTIDETFVDSYVSARDDQ